MKKIMFHSFLLLALIFLTSFAIRQKPHLIVGNWQLTENKVEPIKIESINFFLKRLYFRSDEFTSGISILKLNNNDEPQNEIDLDLAFKIFDADEEFKYPTLVFKNICDKKSMYTFSILQLDKKCLKIKFEKKYSSENIKMTDEILEFDKTAGPSENWETDENSIKFEIEIPKDLNKKNGR